LPPGGFGKRAVPEEVRLQGLSSEPARNRFNLYSKPILSSETGHSARALSAARRSGRGTRRSGGPTCRRDRCSSRRTTRRRLPRSAPPSRACGTSWTGTRPAARRRRRMARRNRTAARRLRLPVPLPVQVEFVVFGAVCACGFAEVRTLVKTQPAEGDRECFQPRRGRARRVVQNCRGVDATAGPYAQWNVREQMFADRFLKQEVEFLPGRRERPLLRRKSEAPVCVRCYFAVTPFQPVTGGSFSMPSTSV